MCCKSRLISRLSRVSCPAPVSHALAWNRYLRKVRGSDSRQVDEGPHPQLCSLVVRRNQVQVTTKWSCSVYREMGGGLGKPDIVNGKKITNGSRIPVTGDTYIGWAHDQIYCAQINIQACFRHVALAIPALWRSRSLIFRSSSTLSQTRKFAGRLIDFDQSLKFAFSVCASEYESYSGSINTVWHACVRVIPAPICCNVLMYVCKVDGVCLACKVALCRFRLHTGNAELSEKENRLKQQTPWKICNTISNRSLGRMDFKKRDVFKKRQVIDKTHPLPDRPSSIVCPREKYSVRWFWLLSLLDVKLSSTSQHRLFAPWFSLFPLTWWRSYTNV